MHTSVYHLSHFHLLLLSTWLLPLYRFISVENLIQNRREYSVRGWHIILFWNLIQVFLLGMLWSELRVEGSLSLTNSTNSEAFKIRLIAYIIFFVWDVSVIFCSNFWRKTFLGLLVSDVLMISISSYIWLQI